MGPEAIPQRGVPPSDSNEEEEFRATLFVMSTSESLTKDQVDRRESTRPGRLGILFQPDPWKEGGSYPFLTFQRWEHPEDDPMDEPSHAPGRE